MKQYILSNRRMLNIIYLFLGCELLGASCFGRDLPVIITIEGYIFVQDNVNYTLINNKLWILNILVII